MVYAQILGGMIVNTIVLGDISLLPALSVGFDSCIRIDNITPQVGVGWSYDGTNFTAPTPIVDPTMC